MPSHYAGESVAGVALRARAATPAAGAWPTDIASPQKRRFSQTPTAAAVTLPDGASLAFPVAAQGAAPVDRIPRRRDGRDPAPLADPCDTAMRAYYELHALGSAPRLHLLPSGDVFVADPLRGRTMSFALGAGRNGGAFFEICLFPSVADGPSVLLALRLAEGCAARVLRFSGRDAFAVDLAGWRPGCVGGEWAWRRLADAPAEGIRHATALPDGRVLVSGGGDGRALALFDPETETWRALPSGPLVRGAPFVASDGGVYRPESDGGGLVFAPPSPRGRARPHLGSAPPSLATGEAFSIACSTEAIDRLVLVRRAGADVPPADARVVELAFAREGRGWARVALPDNPAVAPPGHYWLFAIGGAGEAASVSPGRAVTILPPRPVIPF